MRMFSFETTAGRPLTSWTDEKGLKHRVDPKTSKTVISPMFATEGGRSRFACFHIAPGGFVPRHPAAGEPQLFAVVAGTGWVSGGEHRRVPIKAGQAVLWEVGEMHESGTDDGMTAIVAHWTDQYDPAKLMREIRF